MSRLHPSTLLLGLALTACPTPTPTDTGPTGDVPGGTDVPSTDDTPMMRDVPRRDTPAAAAVCDMPRTLTLMMGSQMLSGNTLDRAMDQTLTCPRIGTAPQEAIILTIPGTSADTFGLRVNTEHPGTDYDTVVEIRPMGCENPMGASCNDDIDFAAGRPESNVTASVTGGSMVALIVSGFDNAAGSWEASIEVISTSPPVLTGATARLVDMDVLLVEAMGTDPDGDAATMFVEFLDAMGMPIAVDNDMDPMTPDVSEFRFGYVTPVTGMMTFTATARATGTMMFPTLVAAAQIRLRLADAFNNESAPMTVPLTTATTVGRGAMCDASRICSTGLVCTAGTCTITPEAMTACMGATAVTLVAPTGTTSTTMTIDGEITPGTGGLIAPCQAGTTGRELVYNVTIPAGMFDLVVTTAGTRTAMADTVVWAMSTCGDAAAEPATYCHDDVAMGDLSSVVTIQSVPAGNLAVAVDLFLDEPPLAMATPVGTTFRLRPIVPRGMACDPMGIENRCAGAACLGGGMCP